MRSQRVYHKGFPTDRILAVLQKNDGTQFDQNLVRRFIQLVGIYPEGNLVRLDTGEIAVVLKAHAPDPYRPRVKILFTADGTPMPEPLQLDLWESEGAPSRSIQAPVDPADYGIDPLTQL
jgi:hypothetical protein